MNKLTRTLLGGTALCALAAPAFAAAAPKMHVRALHAGHVVNKTKVHNQTAQHITYTFSVYTSVPASDFHKMVPLVSTFYKWNSTTDSSIYDCGGNPRMKIKAPKKSLYGKIKTGTESYSFGCSSDPMVFYGDNYKLTDASGEGKTDAFVSTLYAWFKNSRGRYKGTLNLDVSVAIGTE